MLVARRSIAAPAAATRAVGVHQPSGRAPSVRCNSYAPVLELLARAGDVEAPAYVPIVAALVVTAAVTAAVPAYLSRGQDAADKIFQAGKSKALLDKKGGKGKAAPAKGKGGKAPPPARRR